LIGLTIKIFQIFHRPYRPHKQNPQEASIKTAFEVLNFLDRFIKDKFNYHLYLELLPIYLDNKIPEKNLIKTLKEKIYVSVVGSLSQSLKKKIMQYYTEKGIEIYIHEKIIVYMNETDFKTASKFSEAFRDLDNKKIDRLLK
jgi:hypothetical protein